MASNLTSNMIPPSRLDQDDQLFIDIGDSELTDDSGDPITDNDGNKVRGKKS